jgi:hypothetical protein
MGSTIKTTTGKPATAVAKMVSCSFCIILFFA